MNRKWFSLGLAASGLALSAALLFGATQEAAATGQRFVVSVDNVGQLLHTDEAVFNTPVGQAAPGPLLPGNSYQTTVYANPGDHLSLATMFVQSNDWFFAPDERGIPLYNADGSPVSGDVTDYIKLWDAGTEIDEVPGEGVYQAPRQSGPNVGPADADNTVRQVLGRTIRNYVNVTVTPSGNGRFTVNIQNVSGNATTPTPLAPGVAVVHNTPAPLFINGQPDFGEGLEALAEDGGAAQLSAALAARTGTNTPIAPVAWTVHTAAEANPIFTLGQRASAGLEALAEDGGPVALVEALAPANKGAAAVGRGAGGPGPIFAPDGNYSFEIVASPGDHISLAAMFVQSNDWFFSVQNQPLFDADGDPIVGSITHQINLYDAGTEVDQTPGFGADQAPRQAGPNTGAAQGGVVSTVNGINPANHIHVTITPIN